MAYRAGYSQGVTFQLDGAGGATTLAITSENLSESVRVLETTDSTSAGEYKCIAGVHEARGTVEANVDVAALPNAAAPGIVAGAKGTITFAMGATNPFTIHVMVTEVNWKSAVGTLITYNFNVVYDATTATFTRPS